MSLLLYRPSHPSSPASPLKFVCGCVCVPKGEGKGFLEGREVDIRECKGREEGQEVRATLFTKHTMSAFLHSSNESAYCPHWAVCEP